ncbi:hypothetical protein KZO01_23710 [Kurthia zopfii]|uniref:Protein of uncharacterized function (DUF1189) n=1 Tax=Kurthia zopfii TaxID=1650 RepID=A0A2U3A9Q2_9BACL|nr:4-hydroxy-3-methylbut-2-en-1-yl diphosphate synthase [Kurthia zopfii]PWI21230.1 4-hydroxy-3-methylbut-2-en-1-yl diphosphate synthase [Kurthia zopfii]TDR33688.1 hypothetical protein DFR61_1509 [Kurthia zopfii]STX10023.1 Protein of uncharacterised function (DUF1189) [Kurthia zopfii]VEI07625.1 Protein of uncharacterised function (DUF1189) [Kurthia zopfii]GEK32062.1 hypothetical protein KZO01_23710 [Kurthia zopfii]
MNISHRRLLLDALFSPKKHGAYRLLPIGKVIQFTFLLTFIMTILSFFSFSNGFNVEQSQIAEFESYFNSIKWLLYPLSFITLWISIIVLFYVQISIYAAIALMYVVYSNRRGEYRMLWRTATFSSTFGFILSNLLSFTATPSFIILLLSSGITISYLFIAVQKYPKQPNAPKIVPTND